MNRGEEVALGGRLADDSYHIRKGGGGEGRANMSLYPIAFMYIQFSLPSLFLLSPFCLSRYEKVPYETKHYYYYYLYHFLFLFTIDELSNSVILHYINYVQNF